jgi:enoyl-CoA hydratase/carnithine racemase
MASRVEFEIVDDVALLTLTNPGRANALSNATFRDELPAVLAEVGANPDVRALILAGADGAFCAGSELDADGFDNATRADTVALLRGAHRVVTLLRALPFPSIAAIDGVAIGAGLGLAAACDVRLASPRLRASVPHVRMGLTPDMGLTWLLPHVVGTAAALDLALTGRMIGAQEALAIGLVSRIADDVLDVAMDTARAIAALPPGAVQATRELVYGAASWDAHESLFEREPSAFADALHHEDFARHFDAYLESLRKR